MNTNTPTKRLQSLGTALLFSVPALLATQAVSAQTQIINWGGDYVSGNQDFSGKFENGNSDNGYGGFLDGDPQNIAPESNYSGGPIYGLIYEFGEGGSTFNAFNGILNNNSDDRIQLKGDNGINHTTSFLLLWQQQDFLNGGNAASVSFDATSTVRLNIVTYAGQHAQDSGRLVLQLDNGNYYISEQVFTSVEDKTLNDLVNLNYFAYDPASSVNVDNGSLAAESIVSDNLISGITSIGFYFEANGNEDAIRLQNFEVNASVIPEPSTYAMIFGGLALVLTMVRRRQKNG